MKPFNPDKHMREYMMSDESIVKFAQEMGRLSGVIEGLKDKIEDVADNMITRDSCVNIVNEAIDSHKEKYHKRTSIAPAMSVRQKSTLIGAIVTAITAIAAFLSQKFGG